MLKGGGGEPYALAPSPKKDPKKPKKNLVFFRVKIYLFDFDLRTHRDQEEELPSKGWQKGARQTIPPSHTSCAASPATLPDALASPPVTPVK